MQPKSDPSSRGVLTPAKRLVLIIEDDFLTRYTAAEALREMGYLVIEAQDAAEAMSVFTSGTHVDFVFSDINMPGSLNGLEFAGWVAQRYPAVPILLTSGEPQPADALGLGNKRHFMTKPYDLDEVDRWLRQMLPAV